MGEPVVRGSLSCYTRYTSSLKSLCGASRTALRLPRLLFLAASEEAAPTRKTGVDQCGDPGPRAGAGGQERFSPPDFKVTQHAA